MIRMRHALVAASLALSMLASSAHADWSEASSEHFVIYSDQSEKSLRPFAERLELFHATMSQVLRKVPPKPSPSNRVTIFVVSSEEEVRKLVEADKTLIAGIYRPRAGATVALVPQLRHARSMLELAPETVLYHEYAHHFMAGITARAYPRWFVEGFAEFFAGVRFKADEVNLGMPATHRVLELELATHLPIRQLLAFDGGAKEPKTRRDAFYGDSWALFHYLQFAPERAGQLGRYQALLGQGQSALDAAQGAFGDLDKLEQEVLLYWKRGYMNHVVIDRNTLTIGPIGVGKVPPGAAAMIPITMRSKIGLSEEDASALLPEAQQVAAQYPEDAGVLAVLAAVELAAGNDDAAIAAADRALAIHPENIAAHLQKGYAIFNKVESGTLPAESWTWVRNQFAKANVIENDHPIPLIQFYRSYRVQGVEPTRNAVDGLAWAMQLAPFDSSVRWLVSQELISDKRLAEAEEVLAPLAYSPHRNEFTDRALNKLLEVRARIESGQGKLPAGGSP
jgi:tetratricopeptide (TPR) repeat protein